jgi:PadR family transcriptional regulator PadR
MATDTDKTDVLQGTLALMILKTLHTLGPLHGYGIARRIEQVSGDALHLNQGTLYPALVRLEQQGWVKPRWGASDNNRRAKFYSLTPRGERQLAAETDRWGRVAAVVERFLHPADDAS